MASPILAPDAPSVNSSFRIPVASRLSPQHRADLHASGLSDATIESAGLFTCDDPAINARILRWDSSAKNLGPCLVIPFRSMATGELNGFARVKPSKPRSRTDEKTGRTRQVKYEQPRGASARAYVTASAYAARNDPSIRIALTEGEKKALAMEQAGVPAIGLTGVTMWSIKDSKPRELINDLAAFTWQGRVTLVVSDTDARRNQNVNREAGALSLCLMRHGARPVIVPLPIGPTDPNHSNELPLKTGVDDYIVRKGAERFLQLLEFALEADSYDHHY
jgi:hypothetical protein